MQKFQIKTIGNGASSEITKQGYSLDEKGITDWLIDKNIMSDKSDLLAYSDLTPWTRTGGETYSTVFEFSTGETTKQIILKAIVNMFPEKSLLDWTRRREFLAENGIQISNWYFASDATIYEDFYPFTAKEKVEFETLLGIGYKLDSLDFTTLKFIDDIRADKDGNPHFIDFGFDLGEPSNDKTSSAKKYLAKAFPNKILEINNFYDKKD